MAILMGLIYLHIPYDGRRLQNISGVLFFVCINSSLVNVFAVIQVQYVHIKYSVAVMNRIVSHSHWYDWKRNCAKLY